MAELADAQASGACGSNTVRVQVPLPALSFCPETDTGKKRPVTTLKPVTSFTAR